MVNRGVDRQMEGRRPQKGPRVFLLCRFAETQRNVSQVPADGRYRKMVLTRRVVRPWKFARSAILQKRFGLGCGQELWENACLLVSLFLRIKERPACTIWGRDLYAGRNCFRFIREKPYIDYRNRWSLVVLLKRIWSVQYPGVDFVTSKTAKLSSYR